MANDRIVVAGAGGFIGGWLVKDLLKRGYTNILAVDIKPMHEWYQKFNECENQSLDLRNSQSATQITKNAKIIYNLAADMGGMGFIENNKALCMLSVLINTNLLKSSIENGVEKFFFASSACVYNQSLQKSPKLFGLKEQDAYPADPEDGYGWEKLFSERMCRHFNEDFGLATSVARFHNVYGPYGTFDGGREKAPAAICRKVAIAKLSGKKEIDIWGDGEQTRSFTFISDTLLGINKIVMSDIHEPLNLGSSEMVSINKLVSIVEEIAGIKLERNYILNAPLGVRGRNSDNTLIKQYFNWEPSVTLHDGLKETYDWILSEVKK